MRPWLGWVIAGGVGLAVISPAAADSPADPPTKKAAMILVHGTARWHGSTSGVQKVPVIASLDGATVGKTITDKNGAFTLRVPPKTTLSVRHHDLFGDVKLTSTATEQTIVLEVFQYPE